MKELFLWPLQQLTHRKSKVNLHNNFTPSVQIIVGVNKKASCLFVWTYNFIGKNQSDIFLRKNIGENLLSISKLAQSSLFCLKSLRHQTNCWRRTLKIQACLVVHASTKMNKPECHMRYNLTTWVALSCSRGTRNYCQYSPCTPLARVNCGR